QVPPRGADARGLLRTVGVRGRLPLDGARRARDRPHARRGGGSGARRTTPIAVRAGRGRTRKDVTMSHAPHRAPVACAALLALAFVTAPASAEGQDLADFDYENLSFRGVGLEVGYLWPT